MRTGMIIGLVSMAAALAACGDDTTGAGGAGGGSGGGGTGGDSTTQTTATGGEGGAGGGAGQGGSPAACEDGPDIEAVCNEVEACEPGSFDACMDELEGERCADEDCVAQFDAWAACVVTLIDGAGWTDCPDEPTECAEERINLESCTPL